METYDVIMLAVLGGAALFGFMKGFAWQVASLASLVLSYFCAYRFADTLAPKLAEEPRIGQLLTTLLGFIGLDTKITTIGPLAAKGLAMVLIYSGSAFFVWAVGYRLIRGVIDQIRLRELDRQMGGLVGAAKGALLCTAITFAAVAITEPTRAAVLRSTSGKYIATFIHQVKPVIPKEWDAELSPIIQKLEQGLDPTQQVAYPKLPTMSSGGMPGQAQGQSQLQPQGQGTLTDALYAGAHQYAQQYAQQFVQQQFGMQSGQPGATNNSWTANFQPNANPYGTAAPYAPQFPNYQQPQYQPPQYNPAPQYAQPQYGQPQYGQPQYNQPYGQPYAQPNGQPYSQPYGQPYNPQAAPQYGQPYAPQPQYYAPTQPMNPYASGS